ncbi:MAG: archease [Dehalococcoidia bacterium]|nr:archease [Dehalococcoidia bacterium]
MKRFTFVEHTADLGIVAYGNDLEEIFANSAYGLFSIIADLRNVKENYTRDITVSGQDIESLLFTWLNELIYIFDVSSVLFKRFEIKEMNETHLKATCFGEVFDARRHHLKKGVKAATFHLLQVNKDKRQATVIFDV